jgi:septation ring formation regulator EzrA
VELLILVQEEIYQRVAKLEVLVDEHGRKLQTQEEKNADQIELNTILKMYAESQKELVDSMNRFDKTLDKVNINLDGLNKKFEGIDQRVEKLEDNKNDHVIEKLDERVSGIEVTIQETKKTKLGILKYIVTSAATVAITLLIAYLSIRLGLK